MKLEYIVDKNDLMVKEYLEELEFSRRYRKKIKLYGKMIVNGVEVKNHFVLKKGDKLELILDEELNDEIIPLDTNLDIVYEDECLLIVNKPNNLASQPSIKHFEDNLISIVKAHYIKNNITSNIHLVNRLDYATSGLLMIAKDGVIHHKMQENVERNYYAKVTGILDIKKGTIDIGIRRVSDDSILRECSVDGSRAITHYEVVRENIEENYSIVKCVLETGRTHQIRLHMSHIGHLIIGDKLYGNVDGEILYLHSFKISFKHPITNEQLTFIKEPHWLERS